MWTYTGGVAAGEIQEMAARPEPHKGGVAASSVELWLRGEEWERTQPDITAPRDPQCHAVRQCHLALSILCNN